MLSRSAADLVPVAFDGSGESRRPPVFTCSPTDRGPDASWVHLAGELDIATIPLLEETLHASRLRGLRARLVVLDMRDLEFMDASGMRALMEAGNRARQSDGRLVLVRGPPEVDRVFTLTDSRDQFEIVDLDAGEPVATAVLQLAAGSPG